MLLMEERVMKGEMCHAIHLYVKVNNKFIKYYNKNKESSFLIIGV